MLNTVIDRLLRPLSIYILMIYLFPDHLQIIAHTISSILPTYCLNPLVALSLQANPWLILCFYGREMTFLG